MDEQALNELLECSVCLEPLDASSKVLPCQHTFCRRCLEEIVCTKEELRCPECRTLVTVKVEDLPPNILLIRLLEGMKTASVKTLAEASLADAAADPSPPPYPHDHGPGTSGGSQARMSPVHKSPVTVHQPCARALYNYEGTEPGDLSFKKGDMVVLRKQVDENWYHGEMNGLHGFFPAVYVQIINPLPQEIPKCKALYDFYIEDENEKDCLAFSKDSVLTVIRRVDDNWIEGRLGEKIGIFPIAFVELNDAAKYLVNSQHSSNKSSSSSPLVGSPSATQAGNTFSIPTVSVMDTTSPSLVSASSAGSEVIENPAGVHTTMAVSTPLSQIQTVASLTTYAVSAVTATSAVHSRGRCRSPAQLPQMPAATVAPPINPHQHLYHAPMQNLPHHATVTSGGSGGVNVRSGQQGAAAVMTSSASSARPLQHPLVALVQAASQHSPQKRHSLTALPAQTTSPSEAHQRRSLEVTTVSYSTANSSIITSVASVTPSVQVATVTAVSSTVSQVSNAVTPANSSSMPSIPSVPTAIYHALYNYKPQKEDELELHKSDFYTVSEKCQDGWFKGRCLRTGSVGVFPGNYVQVVKASVPRHGPSSIPYVRSHNQHRSQLSHKHSNAAVVNSIENNNVAINGNSPASDYQVRPGVVARSAGHHSRSHHVDGAPSAGDSGQAPLSPRAAPVGAAGGGAISQPVSKPSSHRHRMLPQSQVINSQNMVVVDGPTAELNSHVISNKLACGVTSGSNGVSAVPVVAARPDKAAMAAVKAEKSPLNKHEKNSASKTDRSKSDKRTAVVVPVQIPALPIRNPPSDGASAPEGGNVPIRTSSSSSSPHHPHHQAGLPGVMSRSDCVMTPVRSRSPHGQRVHRSSSGRSKPHHQHNIMQQSLDAERLRNATAHPHHSMVVANSNTVVPPNISAPSGSDSQPGSVAVSAGGKDREKKERKEKEKLSLMKRLTKSKKSRSSPPMVEGESQDADVTHQRTASLPNDPLEGAAAAMTPLPAVPLHKKSGSLDSPSPSSASTPGQKAAKIKPLMRERYRCIVPFPPNTEAELELKVGDIVYVYKKRDDGWFKGTLQRTGKSGLFPGSFVENF